MTVMAEGQSWKQPKARLGVCSTRSLSMSTTSAVLAATSITWTPLGSAKVRLSNNEHSTRLCNWWRERKSAISQTPSRCLLARRFVDGVPQGLCSKPCIDKQIGWHAPDGFRYAQNVQERDISLSALNFPHM